MTKLYKLTENYRAIQGMLDRDFEEISQEEVLQTLANTKDEIEDKVASIGKLVLELKNDIEAVKKEEARLAIRRGGFNSKMEWLKNYLLVEMQATRVLKVKQDVISVSVQDNPPSVEVVDLEQIPEQYIRIIPETKEADKKAITEHFKATGEIIPGTDLTLNRKHVVIR